MFTEATKLFKLGNIKIGVLGVATLRVEKVMSPSFAGDLTFTDGINEIP